MLPAPTAADKNAIPRAAAEAGPVIEKGECPICQRQVPVATADRHVESCMRKQQAAEATASRKRSAPRQGRVLDANLDPKQTLLWLVMTPMGVRKSLRVAESAPYNGGALRVAARNGSRYVWSTDLLICVVRAEAAPKRKRKKPPAVRGAAALPTSLAVADSRAAAGPPTGGSPSIDAARAPVAAAMPTAEAEEGGVLLTAPAAGVAAPSVPSVSSSHVVKDAVPRAAPPGVGAAPRATPQKSAGPAASALRGVYLVPQRSAARAADARLKGAAVSAASRGADDLDVANSDRKASTQATRAGAKQGWKPRGRPPKSRLSASAVAAGSSAGPGPAGVAAAQPKGTASKPLSVPGLKAGGRPKGKAAVRQKLSPEHGVVCSRSRPIADVLSEQKVGRAPPAVSLCCASF